MSTDGITDEDIKRLQEIKERYACQGDPSKVSGPYADSPRIQARILRAASETRTPFKAGHIQRDDRVKLPPSGIGKCLSTLADEGVVEQVRYSNNSNWWRLEADA